MLFGRIITVLLLLWVRMYLHTHRLGQQAYHRVERGEEAFDKAYDTFG
jgi:hypothetical protein